MKKVLLGSTALVGATLLGAVAVAAAEAPTISFSGYTRVEVSFVDQDLSNGTNRGYNFEVDDNALSWTAKGTADNGLTYTATTKLDADGNDAKITVNEAFVTLTNPWGTVIMGEG